MSEWAGVAFVALGSNLGDPRGNLEEAIAALREWAAGAPMHCSSLWRSQPHECAEGTPVFVNGVIGLPCRAFASAGALLARLQALEERYGRPAQRPRNAPRHLDLDIITFGTLELAQRGLVIPHPRACERRFVLAPLAELAPGLRLPGQPLTVMELLAAAPPLAVEKLGAGSPATAR